VNDLNDLTLVETWKPNDEWDFTFCGTFHGTFCPGGGHSSCQLQQVVQAEGLVQSSFLSLKGLCHVV
jgi:hypothetical protein